MTVLRALQSGFPIVERPFDELADRLGCSASDVIDILKTAIDDSRVRAFGPVFDARRLGYVSTLVAARVDHVHVDRLAAFLDTVRGVTHNYLRDNGFNMWFTMTARDRALLGRLLARISSMPGVSGLMDLPVIRVYKIRAVFGEAGNADDGTVHRTEGPVFDPSDTPCVELVRVLQHDFPIVGEPFAAVAEKTGMTVNAVLGTLSSWTASGIIRRFGARLDHRRTGYGVNVLTAWTGDDIDALGGQFADLRGVTHCYRRRMAHGWPYELYAMAHATSAGDMDALIARMRSLSNGADSILLPTRKELKKTTMQYFLEDEDTWDSPSHA